MIARVRRSLARRRHVSTLPDAEVFVTEAERIVHCAWLGNAIEFTEEYDNDPAWPDGVKRDPELDAFLLVCGWDD